MEMEITQLNFMASTFRRIIANTYSDITSSWDEVWCTCIQKMKMPTYVQQYRPITILSALRKVFLKCVMVLCGFFLAPLHFAQHAFRPAHSTQEVIHIIRSVIEEAKEWQQHVFIGDGDISKAYDNTEHNRVAEGLLKKGCPRDLLAAMARSWRNRVKFKLGGAATSTIQETRALMQEDPAAPFCFNYGIDGAIETFLEFLSKSSIWAQDWNRRSNRLLLMYHPFRGQFLDFCQNACGTSSYVGKMVYNSGHKWVDLSSGRICI